MEEKWVDLKAAIFSSCEEHVGYKTRKHRYWFDENDQLEIKNLIDNKRAALQTWRKDITNKVKG